MNELRRFFEWLLARRAVIHLADLHLADLQAYQSERTAAGLGVHSVDVSLGCVLAMLRHQAEQGQTIDNGVFRFRPRPRPESLPRHLSEAESQALERYLLERLDSADAWERLENACLFVLMHGGLRASECVELTVQDLDLRGRRLWVRQGKGRKDRLVYLSETACLALARYLAGRAARRCGGAVHFSQRPPHQLCLAADPCLAAGPDRRVGARLAPSSAPHAGHAPVECRDGRHAYSEAAGPSLPEHDPDLRPGSGYHRRG